MKHLSQQEFSQLKEKLLSKKLDLEEQLSRVAVNKGGDWKPVYKDVGAEEDDSVHEVDMFADEATLSVSLEEHLKEVERALKRMEDGTYGICEVGGEEILHERLLIYPETGRCSEHAQ